ncbi:MAG TPA: Ig-like domain repeat protein [Usitatibacter sp.]|nr:Ig-like domain repeat protein [Usitatibacter sp.]
MRLSVSIPAARILAKSAIAALAFVSSSMAAAAGPGTLEQVNFGRIPGGDNKALAATTQADGKIVTAGYAFLGTKQFSLTRYNANGSVDTAFADGGTRLERLAAGDAEAHGVAVRSDGKIVVGGFAVSDLSRFGIARFNADGSLDTTYGGGGAVTTIGSGAAAFAMAVQPDGKVLLGGWAISGSKKVFAVARYLAESPQLDTSFGTNGVVIDDVDSSTTQQVNAIAVQADGSIVVSGDDGSALVLRRYSATGTLDTSFGASGLAIFSGMKGGRELAIQADGKILAVGDLTSATGFGVIRITSAGALDTTFGVNGIAQQGAGSSVRGNALKVQSDGKIVAAGTGATTRPAVAVARFTADGANDTGFGSSGVTVHQFTISGDEGNALVILAGGDLVVAGGGNDPADCACSGSTADNELLAAFTASGTLDTTFSGGGSIEVDAGSKQGAALASALQSDGKLVVAGYQRPVPSVSSLLSGTLARFNADGSLDTTFGTGGFVTNGADKMQAVAIQSDGKIVAAGYGDGNFGGNPATRLTVQRLNANGTPDTTFGTGGTTIATLDGPTEEANAVAIQPDGKIVVGGIGQLGGSSFSDSLFMRFNADGSIDTTFGTNGKARVAMSTGNDLVKAIALQPDGKIVGAGYGDVSSSQVSIMVTRLNANGAVDTTFGTSGVATTSIGATISNGNALALQIDGKIVVGGKWFNPGNGTDDFALVRYNTDGTLDSSFGTGGVVTTDMGNHNRIFALTLLPSGKIAVAGEWGGAFTVGQYLPSGTLDTSFGTNGTVFAPVNAEADVAYSIVRRSDGKLWVAGDGSEMITLALFTGDGAILATPTVSLASSANPSNAGQSVTFTATVSGSAGTPTGSATFLDGSTAICSSIALSAGTATCATSSLTGGSHSITAQYSGDGTYNATTSSPLTQTVNATKANPSVSLASSANPSNAGQSVTFSATVSGSAGTPTGSATFLDGSTTICSSVALSAGTATCATSSLTAGSHSITARYSGDASYNAATSGAVSQTVQGSTSSSVNVALASNGATVSASSTNAAYNLAAVINGDRTGANITANAWVDDTRDVFPDWVRIDFSGAQTIDHVAVYSVQDNYTSPVEPTDTMTFTSFGLTDFDVQGWNGSAWVTLGSVTGNNLVKRTVSFPAATVSAIRVMVNNALLHYSRIVEIEAWTATSTPPPSSINAALASNGGVASASSTNASYTVAAVNNGDRTGANITANAWVDDTRDMFPDTVEIAFAGMHTIDHVVLYSVQDNYTSPVEPTDTMTFTSFGVTDFDVQGWNGSAWVTLGSVTGNNLVKRTVSFPAASVSAIRVNVNNALLHYSRIVEIEAWTTSATPPPPSGTNFALASNGAVASASSTNAAYNVAAVNNGDRTGANITANAWVDDTRDMFPDTVEIDFPAAHMIDHVVLYSVQDNYTAPAEPTDTMTFTSFGVTDFDVQGWNGSMWVTLGTVTGNNLVKRTVSFPPTSISRVRVVVNSALLHYSRIVEIEAWGN